MLNLRVLIIWLLLEESKSLSHPYLFPQDIKVQLLVYMIFSLLFPKLIERHKLVFSPLQDHQRTWDPGSS